MKFLVLLAIFGFASASVYDSLDNVAEDAVVAFADGLESVPSLNEVLGEEDYFYDLAEYDLKKDLADKFREVLRGIVSKFQEVREKALEFLQKIAPKLREAVQQLIEAGLSGSEKVKEILKNVADELIQVFKQLLNSETYDIRDLLQEILENLSPSKLVEKLKELLSGNIKLSDIGEWLKKAFGDGSELVKQLIETIKNAGSVAIRSLINRILGRETYAPFDNIREIFGNLTSSVKEKLLKFVQWFKQLIESGVESAKAQLEKFRNIITLLANRLAEEVKNVSRDVAQQMKDLLEPFANEFGDILGRLLEAIKQRLAEF